MKSLATTILILIISACAPTAEAPKEENNAIIDNLPVNDRDLLLAPLESALDDLCEVVRDDESSFSSSHSMERGALKASIFYKLDGKDTIMLTADLSSANGREHHEWFADDNGNFFYSQHLIQGPNMGAVGEPTQREYKFYFEDNGQTLSSYARINFGDREQTEDWTPVCLTTEEEQFLAQRLVMIHELLKSH